MDSYKVNSPEEKHEGTTGTKETSNEVEDVCKGSDQKLKFILHKHCNVVINIKGKEITANKNVLCDQSNYFKTMFASDWKEGNTSVVDLQYLNAVFAERVIFYLHTGNIELNKEDVGEILALAHYMQIEELMEKCALFIKNDVDEENCLSYINLLKFYDLENVHEHSLRDVVTIRF